jgi:hypothetical protein
MPARSRSAWPANERTSYMPARWVAWSPPRQLPRHSPALRNGTKPRSRPSWRPYLVPGSHPWFERDWENRTWCRIWRGKNGLCIDCPGSRGDRRRRFHLHDLRRRSPLRRHPIGTPEEIVGEFDDLGIAALLNRLTAGNMDGQFRALTSQI